MFDLSINNETVLDNFDILAVQGMQYVQVQEFELEVETNEILLDFGTVKDKPILSGLEIIQIK
ncbi:malectin domain-containing carbohydrate-binding protein [uncultured Polaribacter sp.]|uniref:malectin domain-containing carbohydrate-binding protein n=1 Tax=uncultured Polaribacter sp. TaxID=174711 RepID=UPI0026399B86|nr:malectin domain-containing carbohydrate-binding protein [uncultured Polaribacter sp.]